MKKGNRAFYDKVLDIPEGQVNDYKIVHRIVDAGTELATANLRTAFLAGDKVRKLRYDVPTRWHSLSYDGGVWMTDLPIEQAQHDTALAEVRNGSILVGGLGLGYALTVLAYRSNIKRIVVVEKSPEVIELVEKATRDNIRLNAGLRSEGKVEIVNMDLFEYLKTAQETFTNAFYDIWQRDGESTFFFTVLPLYKASVGVVKNRPINWNEGVMRGQLLTGLAHRHAMIMDGSPLGDVDEARKLLLNPETREGEEEVTSVFRRWSVPFLQWTMDKKPDAQWLEHGKRLYAALYGTNGFEEFWASWVGHH